MLSPRPRHRNLPCGMCPWETHGRIRRPANSPQATPNFERGRRHSGVHRRSGYCFGDVVINLTHPDIFADVRTSLETAHVKTGIPLKVTAELKMSLELTMEDIESANTHIHTSGIMNPGFTRAAIYKAVKNEGVSLLYSLPSCTF